MNILTEIPRNLLAIQGQKATIFKLNDFGFPITIQCVIEKVYSKDYAQYEELVHIQYKAKRKRTSYVIRLYDYSSIIIFAGHLNIDDNMFVESFKNKETGVTVRKSLMCFDSEYFRMALISTTHTPVFKHNVI